MRRVVITGLGAVSALGNTVAETWEGIKAGRCGIEKITTPEMIGSELRLNVKSLILPHLWIKRMPVKWRAFRSLQWRQRYRQ